MSLTNPDKVVTEERLADFYQSILPYLGGMPDILANKFSKGDLYDTSEKMIGRWIDGKPIYQKTISKTLSVPTDKTQASNDIDVTDLSIDKLIKIETLASGSNFTRYATDVWGSDSEYIFETFYQDNSKNIRIITNRSTFNGITAYVSIRYTKTTDSAVAIGNDTDYSTTEKIVGTWINGKPLYQKTVVFSSQSITNKTYDIATSVDKMIDGRVLLYRTDGGIKQPIIVPYVGSGMSSYDNYVVSGYWKDLNAESNSLKFAFQVGTVPAERTYDVYITVKYTKTTN